MAAARWAVTAHNWSLSRTAPQCCQGSQPALVLVQEAGSAVWLLPVRYYTAANGGAVSFSINLWFRAGNTSGQLFQYLFSHSGQPDGDDWGPNEVCTPHGVLF